MMDGTLAGGLVQGADRPVDRGLRVLSACYRRHRVLDSAARRAAGTAVAQPPLLVLSIALDL